MGFDFESITAPFRMQPGLRRLADGSRQLTPTAAGARAFREKLAVLGTYAPQALLCLPGFDAGPALDALCRHAAMEHPACWAGSRKAGWAQAPQIGWSLHRDEPHGESSALPEVGACLRALAPPWRLPALLSLAFEEDFAVIDGLTAHIPWMAVCLPSRWAPEEKIGRHFAEVHAPVADGRQLVAAGEHLARLVTGGQRWERFVWTITPHPRLHAHPERFDTAPWDADATPAQLAERAYFRTERQTFIPVPGVPQAVFTIHVEVSPLPQALADPHHARRVRDALASMSPAVLAYRGLTDARERLLDWLEALA